MAIVSVLIYSVEITIRLLASLFEINRCGKIYMLNDFLPIVLLLFQVLEHFLNTSSSSYTQWEVGEVVVTGFLWFHCQLNAESVHSIAVKNLSEGVWSAQMPFRGILSALQLPWTCPFTIKFIISREKCFNMLFPIPISIERKIAALYVTFLQVPKLSGSCNSHIYYESLTKFQEQVLLIKLP